MGQNHGSSDQHSEPERAPPRASIASRYSLSLQTCMENINYIQFNPFDKNNSSRKVMSIQDSIYEYLV